MSEIVMNDKMFYKWTQATNYSSLGFGPRIKYSETEFGIICVDWQYRRFKVVDESKYAMFLLKYS